MTVFVSYARQDRDVVGALCHDLELLGREVWVDERLRGGQEWWDQILEHIRSCDVFVWTVSPASVASKACRSELEYASALGRAILPVKIRDVSLTLAPQRIANSQVVDYTDRDASQALRLAGDLQALPVAGPLPASLPAPPPVPITYLDMFADEIGSMAPMSPDRQREVVGYLRGLVIEPGNTEDTEAARGLLHRLRARNEITFESATAIDALLASSARAAPVASVAAAPPHAPPPPQDAWAPPAPQPLAAAGTPAPKGPFSPLAFVGLLLLSLLFGLVGVLVGAFNLKRGPRRSQGIALLALGAASIIAGIGITIATAADNSGSGSTAGDGTDSSDPFSYGDDADLDALWDSCDGADGDACDALYSDGPTGSEYESFGQTCGNRTDGSQDSCAELLSSPFSYGDDADLDALWDGCEGGDGGACDQLFEQSPSGSEYEQFASTCGNRTDGSQDSCAEAV